VDFGGVGGGSDYLGGAFYGEVVYEGVVVEGGGVIVICVILFEFFHCCYLRGSGSSRST